MYPNAAVGSGYPVGFAQQHGSKAGKEPSAAHTGRLGAPDMFQLSQSEPPDGYIFVNSTLL